MSGCIACAVCVHDYLLVRFSCYNIRMFDYATIWSWQAACVHHVAWALIYTLMWTRLLPVLPPVVSSVLSQQNRDMVHRIFSGIENTSGALGVHLPVLLTDRPLFDVLDGLRKLTHTPTLLPTSTRKITQAKMLFDRCVRMLEGCISVRTAC